METFIQSIALSFVWPITLFIGTAFVIWKSVEYLINWTLTTYDRLHQEGN